MPTSISVSVERAGYAEQFVANLRSNMPQALTDLTEAIKNDIALEAPQRTVYLNPKAGDVPLAESFSATPAEEVEESVWEAYVKTSVPAKARSLEYGSGQHGGGGKYPITPKTASLLNFYWENAPAHMGGPGWYQFPRVMHPGVKAYGYIRRTIARWRVPVARKFGEVIRMSVAR